MSHESGKLKQTGSGRIDQIDTVHAKNAAIVLPRAQAPQKERMVVALVDACDDIEVAYRSAVKDGAKPPQADLDHGLCIEYGTLAALRGKLLVQHDDTFARYCRSKLVQQALQMAVLQFDSVDFICTGLPKAAETLVQTSRLPGEYKHRAEMKCLFASCPILVDKTKNLLVETTGHSTPFRLSEGMKGERFFSGLAVIQIFWHLLQGATRRRGLTIT